MLVHLNILCLICINRQYPQNCIEFNNDARVLLNFHSQYSKTRTISNTWLVQTRDRPKPILLVSAVAETVAETENTHSAVAEPGTESLTLVSAETVAETET